MGDKRRLDLLRAGAWLQSRINRFRESPVTWGGLFGGILTLIAFLVVTLWPIVRSEKLDWYSWRGGWWTAIKLAWLPLLMALYLKYSDPVKRARSADKVQRRNRTRRQLLTGAALKEVCVILRNPEIGPPNILDIRERILQSAALGAEELLGISSGHRRVVASLLEFSDAGLTEMRVSCRSTKERKSGAIYKCEDIVGWAAIKDARIVLVDDITDDDRYAHIPKRAYRTVAAVPVGYGGRAYGALSLDHEDAFAFYGKALEIAVQLEPYAATLALTYGPEAFYHACNYEPTGTR